MNKIYCAILTFIIGTLILVGCSKPSNLSDEGNTEEDVKVSHNIALAEAKKVAMENGYNLLSEEGLSVLNGDSEVFKLMKDAALKGGYKCDIDPGKDGYRFIDFALSEKSNGQDISIVIIMARDKVYGAFLDYKTNNGPYEYKAVNDTKSIDRL